jgi:hypothetical protein
MNCFGLSLSLSTPTDIRKQTIRESRSATVTLILCFGTSYNKDGRWCAHGRRWNKTDK